MAAKTKSPKKKARKTEELDFRFVPKRSELILSRKNAEGEVAIIRLDSDQFFYTLQGIGAEVWQAIDGKTPLSKIVDRVRERYEISESRFMKDLKQLLADFRKEKLIR